MIDWQPIETAPTDDPDNDVLLFIPADGFHLAQYCVGYFERRTVTINGMVTLDEAGWKQRTGGEIDFALREPSHWSALKPPGMMGAA